MLFNQRGFTFGEVLASLIALGIIALTVQSLMLVANNFLNQQSSSMSSLQEQTFVSKLICHKFRRPVFVEQDESRSFTYNSSGYYLKKKNVRSTDPATLSAPLLSDSQTVSSLVSGFTDHPAVATFLTNMTKATGENDTNKELRVHINDKDTTTGCNAIDNLSCSHQYHSLFYDIYADNHTLPTFMVNQTGIDSTLGTVSEGYIYASRCIKNETNSSNAGSFIEIDGKYPKYSIIDRTDKSDMTDKQITATALYVLEQKWRPFYFPKQDDVKNQVICCDITMFDNTTNIEFSGTPPSIPANCGNLEKYTPIIYVIKISSDGGDLEDKIPDNDSLEGYAQNESASLKTNSECKCPSGTCSSSEDIHWDNGGQCEGEVKRNYFRTLGKRFAHPVQFDNIEELPLVKRDRVNSWAYSFIAPSFEKQDLHKEFKIISIENKCHASMPIGLCGKAVPGKDLLHRDNLINTKSVADFFIAKVRACPFNYVTMSNSAGTLPLGLDRVQ